MCDSTETTSGTGWRGWNMSDTSTLAKAADGWIDLTWPLSPSVPRLRSFPPPRIERVASLPEEPLNITELSMIVHIGTHVDSPRRFFSDGPALEDVPPRLVPVSAAQYRRWRRRTGARARARHPRVSLE
jgi:hypothetical protein